MKLLVDGSVRQPITVSVGVILALLAGLVAFTSVPIQLAPQVDSTVISVRTSWPIATPDEIESDIIQEQEDVLADIDGLTSMISTARTGSAEIRLEFQTGTDINDAVAAVDQKLAQVPFYPDGVNNPEINNQDPQSIDFIAWVGLSSDDPDFEAATLGDFMERILRPRFERIPGVAEVDTRGIRRSEMIVTVDAQALARRGLSWGDLVNVLQANNQDSSGGALIDGKRDIRIRLQGRFQGPADAEQLVIRRGDSGTVRLGDVATVSLGYTEANSFVRIRGVKMPVFNFQLARGANLLGTMERMKAEFRALNAPGGLLERQARLLDMNGELTLVQVYDASLYVNQAIDQVQSNILVGSVLAVLVLLLFLRSWRSIGIIALSIPISVIASVAVLTAMGRSVNLISLAGFAFSIGMVVDNTIVVIENVYRHLEMGKQPRRAARDGAAEVASAVFASTLTTLVVFLPVLLIEETAGQLFRDIALAIMAAVGLSLITSLTVIPAAASRLLKPSRISRDQDEHGLHRSRGLPARIGKLTAWLGHSWLRRISVVLFFTLSTVIGIWLLKPPLDYLPSGSRNLVFGMNFAPPGYSLEQLSSVADRIEARMRPFFEATEDKFPAEAVQRGGPNTGHDRRHPVPVNTPGPGPDSITPPKVEHYFLGSFNGLIFHGAVSADPRRAVDLGPLLEYAASPEVAPDMFGFARQPPIFRTGGTTGAAISVNFIGDDLEAIANAGSAAFFKLMGEFGPRSVRPTPSNFLLRTPQLRIDPDDHRLQEVGLNRRELGYALQAAGDGIRLVKVFSDQAELKDLRIRSSQSQALDGEALRRLENLPIATPAGGVVDLGSLATISYERVSDEIQRVGRNRAVTIEFTPPQGIPLETALERVDSMVAELRSSGAIPPDISVSQTGSAGNLAAIKEALAGDGSIVGLISSSLFLSLLVVYLVLVVLFQSWLQPSVIMVAVPLATLGGFVGLGLLHWYSLSDRYTPVVKMDVLTLLGFVILAGVVVNNAILIVSQALNLRAQHPRLPIASIISEATASRVRPIAMSMMTSIGSMLPLVLLPGSGSELYRGLAAVMVGGLALSTVFTLILVPVLLEVVLGLKQVVGMDDPGGGTDENGRPDEPDHDDDGPASGNDGGPQPPDDDSNDPSDSEQADAGDAEDSETTDADSPQDDGQNGDAETDRPSTAVTPPVTPPPTSMSQPRWRPGLIISSLLVMAMMVLAGCTAGPDYRGPPATVPDDYSWVHGAAVATSDETVTAWWSDFDDPHLDTLIRYALEHNHELQAGLARLEAARQRLIAVSRADLPSLEALARVERQRTSGSLGGGSFGTGITDNRIDIGLVFDWEIDVWGKARRQTEAAQAGFGIAAADLDGLAVSLRADIADAYVRLREIQTLLASAEQQLALLNRTVTIAQARLDSGLDSTLAVERAQQQHETLKASLSSLRRTRDEILSGIALLLSELLGALPEALPEHVHQALHTHAPIPTPPAHISMAIPADLLRRRPDLRAAERRLAAASARIGIATADLYPSLSLRGTFGWAAASGADLFSSSSQYWSAGPGISASIFDRTRLKALVGVEKAEHQAAIADYEQTVLAAGKDVEDALAAFTHEQQRSVHLGNAADAAQRASDVARQAFEAGLSDYQAVLDARQELLIAEDRRHSASASRSRAVIALYRAMGGAWKSTDADATEPITTNEHVNE